MLNYKPSVYRLLSALAVVSIGAAFVAPLSAQQQIGSSQDANTFAFKFKDRFESLRDNKAALNAKDDAELIKVTASFLVGRLTWPGHLTDSNLKEIQANFKDLMNKESTLNGKNQEFMKVLVPALIANFSKILLDDDSFARDFHKHHTLVTNAALMLPNLAKCKQIPVHDFLLKLASTDKDNQPIVHPFIRMCAIKGLGELNHPSGPQVFAKDSYPEVQAEIGRAIARLQTIAKFIDQPYPPQGKGPDYDDAFRYIRREGVKAIAQVRTPAFSLKEGPPTASAAYELLKIANGGQPPVEPPYSLSERIEAAIGICQLDTRQVKSYNADLAVFVVASVLVDMADAYSDDLAVFKGTPKDKDGPRPLLPWKYYATVLEDGLVTLAANLADVPARKKLDEGVRNNIKATIDNMKAQKANSPPQVLQNFVAANRPAVMEVFIGNKDFVLK